MIPIPPTTRLHRYGSRLLAITGWLLLVRGSLDPIWPGAWVLLGSWLVVMGFGLQITTWRRAVALTAVIIPAIVALTGLLWLLLHGGI